MLPVVLMPAFAQAQLAAFPGADGAAAHVTGGRGGIVYHMTKPWRVHGVSITGIPFNPELVPTFSPWQPRGCCRQRLP